MTGDEEDRKGEASKLPGKKKGTKKRNFSLEKGGFPVDSRWSDPDLETVPEELVRDAADKHLTHNAGTLKKKEI